MNYIIYKQKGVYASFPLVEQTENQIYVSFFCSPEVDHFGIHDWYSMISTDDGKTWRLLRKKTTNTISARQLSDQYIFKNDKDLITTGGIGFYFKNNKIKSCPNLYKLTSDDYYNYSFAGLKSIIVFPRFFHEDNLILIPCYGITEDGNNIPFVWRSEDNGDNFELIQMFNNPYINGNEMAFINTTRGIYALIRQEKNIFMLESWSYDKGRTWTYPVYNFEFIGFPPHLLRLKNGNILCSYGFRKQPMGIRAKISVDDCKSWGKEIILRDDGGYPSELHKKKFFKSSPDGWSDVGYPVSIQLQDESILTVYYITTEDRITHIAATKWTI